MATLSLVVLCLAFLGANAAGVDYENPGGWGGKCNLDTSKQQSPIDIKKADAEEKDLSDFVFKGYSGVSGSFANNGHSVQLTLSGTLPELSGGGLDGTFKLAQFHFHWGSDNSKGSEHTMDGKKYPMEVHFVHYNTKYDALGTAADKSDGLAVLGFFFEVGDENTDYKPIFDAVTKVKDSTTVTEAMSGLDMMKLMGETESFYRYSGSLTTPACYESVTWTVFPDTITVSSAQMELIRAVTDGAATDPHNISNNYRPVQNLHDRKVYTNGETSGAAATSAYMGVLVAALALALLS